MNILSQTVPIQFDTGFSPYHAARWHEAFRDVAARGLTGVEIAVAYPNRVDAAEVLSEAKKHGLSITTISTGQICGLEGFYLTSPYADMRRNAASTVYSHIELAARLDMPCVTLGLIRGKPCSEQPDKLTEMLLDILAPLCARAEELGVTLQLEAINAAEAPFIHSTAECLDFIKRLGSPKSLGLLYDTYHSFIEDGDMQSAIKAAAGRITNVHLADSHRGLPGEGEIDFAAVCGAIKATGYTGPFALETKCIPSAEHVLEHYASSIKKATE